MKFGTVTQIGTADPPLKFRIFEIQDLKNHKNRDISSTVWPIFAKFGTLM